MGIHKQNNHKILYKLFRKIKEAKKSGEFFQIFLTRLKIKILRTLH